MAFCRCVYRGEGEVVQCRECREREALVNCRRRAKKELLHKLCTEDLPDEAWEDAWEQFSGMLVAGTYGPKDMLHTSIQAFAHKLMEKYE